MLVCQLRMVCLSVGTRTVQTVSKSTELWHILNLSEVSQLPALFLRLPPSHWGHARHRCNHKSTVCIRDQSSLYVLNSLVKMGQDFRQGSKPRENVHGGKQVGDRF